MKKSEIYRMAMLMVIDSDFPKEDRAAVMELLSKDKESAEWSERRGEAPEK